MCVSYKPYVCHRYRVVYNREQKKRIPIHASLIIRVYTMSVHLFRIIILTTSKSVKSVQICDFKIINCADLSTVYIDTCTSVINV